MAQYSKLLGQRVEVEYRAGDVLLAATGKLAADSGKSIFLEEHSEHKGKAKTFRWEIPYPCILAVDKSFAPAPVCPADQPDEAKNIQSDSSYSPTTFLKNRTHEA